MKASQAIWQRLAGGTPRSRRLSVGAAVAVLALGLALAAPAAAQFGKNKVRYQDFKWKIYHSPHFDVYYYEEEAHLLQKVVSFAESAYDQLSQDFDFKIEEPTPLIFYATHAEFEQNNIILNFIPEGVGAFASPVRNRMVMPVDLPDPELMALILHELTHIFEYHILFGANLGKGVASSPPTWFMEGLASYMAQDETARDKMYLRDAVVNDRIPQVTQDFGGFFAYRFGHAVFEFIVERWGQEALRDFMFEIRNTLGGRVGRAVERTFNMPAEDFDGEFRRWLRRRYLPELVETGEPADFGRPYRTAGGRAEARTSPTASPSGDLLAAFTTNRGQLDVMLFDNRKRKPLRNLTQGYDNQYQYLVAQELTMGRKLGRDLAFSPDGNYVAMFARKNRGRVLVLLDVLKGKVAREIEMEVGQQFSPAFSPDGRTVIFSGNLNGQFDIFALDLETEAVSHVTQDEIFDGSPVYSPDGQSIVLTSVVGGYGKLFRIDLDQPGARFPLTEGETNETDAVYSPDGGRIYFTSDRTGANNIFSLELETGTLRQHTNSVTGCFMPTVLAEPDGSERLVYTAFWKGRFDLYQLDLEDPITEARVITEGAEAVEVTPVLAAELPRYEPSIEVAIDDENIDTHKGFKFFVEDLQGTVGVSDDQTFVGLGVLTMSDFLGDRRIIAVFQSIESFQNFDVFYLDLSNRLQWQLHLYDNRDFFLFRDQRSGFIERGRSALSLTGVSGSLIYPFNVNYRGQVGLGFNVREIDFFIFAPRPIEAFTTDELLALLDPAIRQFFLDFVPPGSTDEQVRQLLEIFFFPGGTVFLPISQPRDDEYPELQASLVGDTAVFSSAGAVSGRRWNLSASYAPDLDASGTLTSRVSLDFRQYVPITRRMNLAFRAFGSMADGNFPTPIYFGGLDTVRGVEFRSLVGDRAFFTNLELRFPLVDLVATPIFVFQGIRGVIFLDVAGAWVDEFESFRFYNSDLDGLQDAVSSYGYGVTFRLFGLDFNIDFAKRWNFDRSFGSFDSSFWIGRRF